MSAEMYGWAFCSHAGIGLPGCRTCDPDKFRVAERYELQLAAAQAEVSELRRGFGEALDVLQYSFPGDGDHDPRRSFSMAEAWAEYKRLRASIAAPTSAKPLLDAVRMAV
jgi:hypothetical protein